MAYFKESTGVHILEYSIYEERLIFVHFLEIKKQHRRRGNAHRLLDKLKIRRLPIVLECHPKLVSFYVKVGLHEACVTREGYIEMVYLPPEVRR